MQRPKLIDGRRRNPIDGECYYCGDYADTVDHVIPRAARSELESTLNPFEWQKFEHCFPNVVPCCFDCNMRKNNLVFDSVPEICSFIANSLYKRHRRLIDMPLWTLEELDELGDTLRENVENRILRAEHQRHRLHTLRARS